ncbi:MAG: TrkA family potassium uptake protein [Actinobacteria bacterium]|nr:MAG: TrkA family potassium uptake protein [Actinomycetota bacterium]
MRVVIAGAGNVGSYLASDLTERRHQVVVIEQKAELASRAKNQIPGATVIHGDACEPWVLERAEAARADVVVSATGDDEDNLVISLLAKQEFAVPRVIARVNHPKNQWLFTESWGVDVAMSPPHILGALIEEAVSVGDLVKLFRLEHGRVALVEVTLPGDSPVVGKHIYDLRLPHDCALVAVIRDGHVIIPEPETPLTAGDEVLAIATTETEDMFRRTITGG